MFVRNFPAAVEGRPFRCEDVRAMFFQCRDTQEFIDGMLRCKGNARAIDQAGLETIKGR